MRRRRRPSGLTLLEMIVVSGVMSFALLLGLQALNAARNINDRAEILTRHTLRAHSEIESLKAAPFERLTPGATPLTGFTDPQTTGAITIERLEGSPGLRLAIDIVTHRPRSVEKVHVAALRFPEVRP